MPETKEVWFTTTRNGARRAWYYDHRRHRALPLPAPMAELLLATGAATHVPANPHPAKPATIT